MSGTDTDRLPLYKKGDPKPDPGTYVRFSNNTVALYGEDGKFKIVKGGGKQKKEPVEKKEIVEEQKKTPEPFQNQNDECLIF